MNVCCHDGQNDWWFCVCMYICMCMRLDVGVYGCAATFLQGPDECIRINLDLLQIQLSIRYKVVVWWLDCRRRNWFLLLSLASRMKSYFVGVLVMVTKRKMSRW